jgi:CRP-like cAMP-binding protein
MGQEVEAFLASEKPVEFDAGSTLILNTYLQPGAVDRTARVAYVREGLVRGAWHRPAIAPSHDATVLVAGDRSWIGLDAFKYHENLFHYTALAATTAWILPLSDLVHRAPREVLLDALQSATLAWCTAASVVSLKRQKPDRLAMLLLYNLSRLHPHPVLQVTQQVVAELLGTSRQSLNPVLKRLEQRGFVRLGYGKVAIEDPARIIEELRRTAKKDDVEPDPSSAEFWGV